MSDYIRRCTRVLLVSALLSAVLILPLSGFRHIIPTAQAATTFTVNATSDGADNNLADNLCNDGSGVCTLRAAIQQANALSGLDTINFSIGSGVKSIALTSALPNISDPVVIDGTTQPGFAGTPIIEINGTGISGAGFFITAGSSTIKGLVINRVSNAAIALITNGGNRIEGNYIGTDVTGSLRMANHVGLIVNTPLNTIARNVISGNSGAGIEFNVAEASDNVIEGNYIGVNAAGTARMANNGEGIRLTGARNKIGGATTGAGNVISGNTGSGILVGGQMSTIQGNFIGTNAAGTAPIPNRDRGIRISQSPNNIIGGTSATARNVISGNWGAGISLDEGGSTGNVIQGNFIGTDVSGLAPLPNSAQGIGGGNSSGGIFINRGTNNLIGGSGAGEANTIAFNGTEGIRVVTLPNTSIGVGNRISRNPIFGNFGLGIDLGSFGVTLNDSGDVDTNANKQQNFPVITSVTTDSSSTTVQGNFNSAPNTNYELEFFANQGCHASGYGEGARFLATNAITTDANGNAGFNVVIQSPLSPGQVVTATATDPDGNTSEFSACNANGARGILQFGMPTIRVREDLSVLSIPVIRLGGSSGTVSVNFASTNNTAIAGQDYSAISGTLTFADGETSKTISLPITNDMLDEDDETLFVALSNPTTPELVGASGTISITISDPFTASAFFINDVSISEGNSGTKTALVTVGLTMAIGQTATVNYQTAAMTATSGVDFQPVSGSLTFAPGVISQTVAVPIIGDTIDEPDETLRISLSNAVGAAIIVSSNPPVILIVDDDPLPAISVSDTGVIEGASGTTNAVFTVTLSAKSSLQVSVNYATADGTANAGADYQSASGTVVFVAGETSKTVTVLVNSDAVQEQPEAFFLNLSTPVNATIADAQGVGTISSVGSAGVGFSATAYSATETDHQATITVSRSGDTSGAVSVDYSTENGSASDRSDYTTAMGTLRFAAGETTKTFTVLLNEDGFQEGAETIILRLNNSTSGTTFETSVATLTVIDTTASSTNPVDNSEFFVRQHYHDFLNREPDAAGLAFWANQITECQQPGATCNAEVRRVNVSAAFFVSIEFQETGYLVYKFHKAAYGNIAGAPVPLRLNEFLPDTQQIGQGLVVGETGWQQKLESNKVAYAQTFVSRARFTADYPTTLSPAGFVDALFAKAGVTPSTSERDAAISEFGGAANTADTAARARALRRVAENATFSQQEFNRAFVLMQYFGYLRRDPNAAPEPGLNFDGYNFWLGKLNEFNGNYIAAELVKAFIASSEYRQRFGQ